MKLILSELFKNTKCKTDHQDSRPPSTRTPSARLITKVQDNQVQNHQVQDRPPMFKTTKCNTIKHKTKTNTGPNVKTKIMKELKRIYRILYYCC